MIIFTKFHKDWENNKQMLEISEQYLDSYKNYLKLHDNLIHQVAYLSMTFACERYATDYEKYSVYQQ